jgi:hypothetical protein
MSLQDESNSIKNLDFQEINTKKSFKIIKNFQKTNDTFGVLLNGDVIYITKYGMYDLYPNIQLTVIHDLSFCDVFKHGITLNSQFEYEISKAKPVETVIQKKILKQNLEKYDLEKYDLEKYDMYTNKNTEKSNRVMLNKNIKQLSKTARSRKKKILKPNKLNEMEMENTEPFHNDTVYICDINQSICKCDQCITNQTCQHCGSSYKQLSLYDSIYSSIDGTIMCDNCAKYECCPNCGWESGGSYCNYCRSDY